MAKKVETKFYLVTERFNSVTDCDNIMNAKDFQEYKRDYLAEDEVVFEIQVVKKFAVKETTSKKLIEIGIEEVIYQDEDEEDY